jgi:tRNA (guanine37-N1)-methyltransferase
MVITIITLFPKTLEPLINFSILKRAQEKQYVKIELLDLREFGDGLHKTVDDRPYGGGAGMILKAEVLKKAILKIWETGRKPYVILTSAGGHKYTQKRARELSLKEDVVVICGHYEGVDARFIENYVDEEISIGDYVLTGGELPSLVILDSIVRLLPGVLKKEEATLNESFEEGLLEYPHFTRPEVFEEKRVPEILLSGDHKKIADWRKEQSVEKTRKERPDLITQKDQTGPLK